MRVSNNTLSVLQRDSGRLLTESRCRRDGNYSRRQWKPFYPGCPGDCWLDRRIVESGERGAEGVGSHVYLQ
jgi:hypothetical protein